MKLNLREVLDEPIDWRFKGFPVAAGVRIGNVGAQGWHALDGDLSLPIMLLKDAALRHNVALMASYCERHNVRLMPHGKTAMSPQLLELQMAAGAWGVTVATVSQARVYRHFGADRILIANQVLRPDELGWITQQLRDDPDLMIATVVDSLEGVEQMTRNLRESSPAAPLPVMIELGFSGGRAGCRDIVEVLAVARALERSEMLRLIGVEGFEGVMPGGSRGRQLAGVHQYLRFARAVVTQLHGDGLFGADPVLVSFGGSSFFDAVTEELARGWAGEPNVEVILRSGCYLTHDSDFYACNSPFMHDAQPLQPALEAWALVMSRPEPELAVVGLGKRDVSFDCGPPLARWQRRPGELMRPTSKLTVSGLNDQHAFVHVPRGEDVRVGDLLGFGVSHPCTAFDKWQLLPVVDDGYHVIDAIRTFF